MGMEQRPMPRAVIVGEMCLERNCTSLNIFIFMLRAFVDSCSSSCDIAEGPLSLISFGL